MENVRAIKFASFIIVWAFIVAPFFVSAYEPNTTHKGLTRDIMRFFEYAYPNTQFTDAEQSSIEQGAVDEDANIRALFHFYDPIHNRGLKGNLSSKDWAQSTIAQARMSPSYLASIGSMALSFFRSDTDFSWDRAVYEYVHGDKKRALESLGHALHLLEDATVPDHTRNDAHPPFFDSLFAQASPYEHWTSENFNAENISVTKNLMEQKQVPVTLTSLDAYFDALATYSNKNFFSKSTIFDSYYNEPTVKSEKDTILSDDVAHTFGYGSEGNKLIEIERVVDLENRRIELVYKFPDKDRLILSDYWNLLSKQAVMHGAGVVWGNGDSHDCFHFPGRYCPHFLLADEIYRKYILCHIFLQTIVTVPIPGLYFAHPGSPWERGTNENTNGLIRQYFPKGTDFSKISVRKIKHVKRELNDRPRAVLHYQKPDEVINQLVALKV